MHQGFLKKNPRSTGEELGKEFNRLSRNSILVLWFRKRRIIPTSRFLGKSEKVAQPFPLNLFAFTINCGRCDIS
jgi:hypothetical protein